MREFEMAVGNEFSGRNIKFILTHHWKFSNGLITRLKKDEGILLNGKREFVTKLVKTGDVLKINLPEEGSEGIVPNDIPLDILYEDDDILAVNKPYNMPTHPSFRHFEGTLANAVMNYYKNIPFTFRAITRLDRDTSGVVIIAKNIVSADRLSKSLSGGGFKKEYVALCVGTPCPEKGIIDAPIKRETDGIIKRCIAPDGKSALTEYEVIFQKDGLSLVRLFPKTGRTHQLRLHLAHIGTPIYSDFLYGTEVSGERTRLHASRIVFPHPFSKEILEITAPIPCDMKI